MVWKHTSLKNRKRKEKKEKKRKEKKGASELLVHQGLMHTHTIECQCSSTRLAHPTELFFNSGKHFRFTGYGSTNHPINQPFVLLIMLSLVDSLAVHFIAAF